jgi:hypothetical protein
VAVETPGTKRTRRASADRFRKYPVTPSDPTIRRI